LGETIPLQNDRTFTTGSGNWSGTFTWNGDVLGGKQGNIRIVLPSGPSAISIALAYPAIKPEPGQLHVLLYKTYRLTSGFPWCRVDSELTDGVYAFTGSFTPPSGPGFWDGAYVNCDIPADWDKLNTQLTLTINNLLGLNEELALDEFSLLWSSAKIQHLPLVGIG
jgi:hypothetical protein